MLNATRAVLIRMWLWAALCLLAAGTGHAASVDARQTWQLLDYIAVDYSAAVADGQVIHEGEYAEMVEFARTVRAQLADLPAKPGHEARLAAAERLQSLIAARADAAAIAGEARSLAATLVTAYAITAEPSAVPSLERGAELYRQQCASCHGARGAGDGPAGAGLDPPPIAFTDKARAAERSPHSLYQTITQGVAGTGMPPFAHLSEADRWALAFYTGGMAFSDQEREEGRRHWETSAAVRDALPDLAALAASSPAELARTVGPGAARPVSAYLRANPTEVASEEGSENSLALAHQRVNEAVAAYQGGQPEEATRLALSAYLDGVEPVEPILGTRDPALLREVEAAMAALRADISAGVPASALTTRADEIHAVLVRVEGVLGESGSAATAFLGSFTMLLREGVEALLIVIGMITFLRKGGRADVLPYVHGGWISALVAGVATWILATTLISISGAQREVTEGLSALFASLVLLSVGIWMHQKSLAGRWQQYLQAKLSSALNRRSALFLFGLAFIAVYREVFETILFYAAMWNERDQTALLSGLVSALIVLAVLAWALLHAGMRLPIGKFFSISSVLIAILAVVLAGKGVGALQEAGWLAHSVVSAPRIDWLGLYPSMQSLLAQAAIAAIAIVGFIWNARPRPTHALAKRNTRDE